MDYSRRGIRKIAINKKLVISVSLILVLSLIGYLAVSRQTEGRFAVMTLKLGIENGQLVACPNRENCRNSDDPQDKFRVPAIGDREGEKWSLIIDVMASLPRTRLIKQEADYLHFTQSSKVLRFVDDIEFHNRPESGQIAIRSASRLGYRDFGVNQARLDEIVKLLKQAE
jgi:uncharacterized protein (DUF1499 family)